MRARSNSGRLRDVLTIRTTGPLASSARALGPDLARGVMLLFIALANSHYFLTGGPGGTVRGGFPEQGSMIDDAAIWFVATFVDGRAFPMFGLLFGYGVARIASRNVALEPRHVRRLLWRRSAVLIAIGFVHAILLFVGDILAAYGVLLLLGAWVVRSRDRWLVVAALFFFVLCALPSGDSGSISTVPPGPEMLPPDLLTMLSARLPVQPFIMLVGPVGFACPFLVGLLAGRRRILERPGQHVRLLAAVATGGIGAAVLGAQPVALMLAGVTAVPDQATLELIGPLHDGTGVLGGFGYAAALALLSIAAGGRCVRALAAAGQRSMTCYLAQSVVWAVVFTPFLLDLAGTLSVAGTAVLATATWLVSVLLAEAMRRAGSRGPFERLVRRVTYGRAQLP